MDDLRKPLIGYMCSYFPSTLVRALGCEAAPFSEVQTRASPSAGVLPVTMCSYTRQCMDLMDGVGLDGMVLTNCCNSMQRLYDYVKVKHPEAFCYMLDLPRGASSSDRVFFTKSIEGLLEAVSARFSRPLPGDLPAGEVDLDGEEDSIEADTVYVLGSAMSPMSRQMLAKGLQPYKVKTNLCCDRDAEPLKVFPFERMVEPLNREPPASYATRLLFRPCARMDWFTSWFEQFLVKYRSCIAGIIYLASQHCDSFLFRYPSIQRLCKRHGVHIIYLEEAYHLTGFNRVLTRLEAFTESLTFASCSKTTWPTRPVEDGKVASGAFTQRMRLVQGIVPGLPLEAIRKVVANQVGLFTKEVWAEPHRIVWTNMAMTVEILYAAGLIPVNMELVAGWLASLGLSREYVARSEGLGISSNLCSYHKAVVGLADAGGLPPPQGAVISSHVCDAGIGMAYYLAERYGSRIFVLHIPYHNDQRAFTYLLEQYTELLKWVESYAGVNITRDMLAAALERSSQARMYWTKALNLRKGRPLFPGHWGLRNLFGATFLFGSELGVEVAKAYYEQLQALSEDGGEDLSNRKRRLLWVHFAPLYGNKAMEYLEKELNCWIVADIVSHIYWPDFDLDRPLESLVEKSLSHFYLGDVTGRKETYRRLMSDYQIDGVIHFMHNGCRAIPGSAWLVREVANELGLPYLELTGDCIDPRGYSDEQFRLRLEAFRETLGRRRIVPGD